jgi:hypothetical protein
MRIDPALWRELERWAADDLRSINGQIEFVLREALRRRGVSVGGGAATDAAASADTTPADATPADATPPEAPR